MEYATFVCHMCTKCKKPCITVLRQQKVVLCVVGVEEYGASLLALLHLSSAAALSVHC
jgi:hypothetical protein